MRAFRLVVVSLLIAAGAAIGAPSAYADGEVSLGVSPGHGSPDAQFTATARWQAVKHGKNRVCLPTQITFQWDGAALGTAAAVPVGDTCIATLSATPPAGTYQGVSTHTISVAGVRAARVAYRVVAAAAPANPPSSAATAAATPDSTETATAEAQPSSPAGPVVVATGGPTGTAAGSPASDSGSGLTGLIVALGSLLFLAGAAAFGAMVWRARRAKQDAAAYVPETFYGTAAVAGTAAVPAPEAPTGPLLAPTQAFPIPRQASGQDDPQTVQLTPPAAKPTPPPAN